MLLESMTSPPPKPVLHTFRSIRKRVAPKNHLDAARRRRGDVSEKVFNVIREVDPYTMVGPDRLLATILKGPNSSRARSRF